MTHLSTRKAFGLIPLATLVLVLLSSWGVSVPVTAQGPTSEAGGTQVYAPSPERAPDVEYDPGSPADLSAAESTGYLHVHVYDELSRRPLGNRVITVYDRDAEQVAQVTTACQGYVEFTDLPTGPYRIVLEADPDWIPAWRDHSPGARNYSWVWVRPTWRVGVRFYELPNVTGAGLRVEAYHADSRRANQNREPLAGAAFTVYDAAGNFVANGTTGCGGFVDFNNLSAGQYRVVDANEAVAPATYPPSGERWVSLQHGSVTRVWFFTVPSPGPQSTPTPEP